MKKTSELLSIVIPVYNEAERIAACVNEVLNADTLGYQKELIVVDDGSTDATWNQLVKVVSSRSDANVIEATLKNSSIVLVRQAVNHGKGTALKRGFLQSHGDIVLVQDADLEYSPSDYPEMLGPFIHQSADAVFGSRFISHRPHRVLYYWHYQVNRLLTGFSNICTNLNLTDMETGYKAFRGELIRSMAPKLKSQRFGFEPEITARLARVNQVKLYEVGISYTGRTYQEGKKIGWKDGVEAIWCIIKYNWLESGS